MPFKVPTNEGAHKPSSYRLGSLSCEQSHDSTNLGRPSDLEKAISDSHSPGQHPLRPRPPCKEEDDSDTTLPVPEGGERLSAEKARLEAEQDENENYPEGGLRAWLVVLGSFLLSFAGLGVMNTMGTFQTYLAENDLKDHSHSSIGWIFGTHPFLAFLCGVKIGPIFDKHGPRLLVLAGSIGLIAMFFIMSICKEFYQYFLTFGILGGTSVSLVFTPSIASVGHWFQVKRATATGIAVTGASIGGIVFPLVFQQLIPQIGFPWACRVVGFIELVLLIPANFLIRSRLKPTPDAKARIDLGALRDPIFALTTFGAFLIEWGLFIPITYQTSYAIAAGVEEAFSYQLVAIFNTGSVFGRWLPNYAADKLGRFNIMIIMAALCVIVTLGLWLPGKGEATLIAFAVLYGFGSGSGISLAPVCVGQICRTEDYGKRYGTCYFIASFASLTSIPIAGAILTLQNGDYSGLIWFAAGSYIGTIIVFTAARIIGGGWKLTTVY
ncbi:MFS monocarboxylate transporter [Kalaharituber pfeilii]|nr:MFS monocarboxylate transporter [Kalaharituber pfeilii]